MLCALSSKQILRLDRERHWLPSYITSKKPRLGTGALREAFYLEISRREKV